MPPPGPWECYLDQNGTRATFFEEFTDESALAACEVDLARLGLRDEVMGLMELVSVKVLGEVRDPEIAGAVNQMGADVREPAVGFTRS